MDPIKRLIELLDAIRTRNVEDISDADMDLVNWINKGGFSPVFDVTEQYYTVGDESVLSGVLITFPQGKG
jgi:hypothetical protein